ncbi:MAG: lipid-A-disaccharide synthase, partial [Chloroherpetonaceae bacterium]|nr:lipid-A-disaccharide synthase [Chloroherpetonaceae bacterium]
MSFSSDSTPTLFVVAGEASGDLHGAWVMRELLKAVPTLRFFGIGGVHLAELGMQQLYRAEEVNLVGFLEVAKRFNFLRHVMRSLKAAILQEKPDAALLIDYPGMNLRLAKFLSEQRIPVIYYIAPQVWAWREKRVELIRKYVSRLLVVFEFEQRFFAERGVSATFVGHPILEEIAAHKLPSKSDFLRAHHLPPSQRFIGLLPGSRQSEVKAMLPPMLEAAAHLEREFGTRSLLGVANTIPPSLYQLLLARAPVKPIYASAYQTLAYSDLALVTSGTVTLEALAFGTPMIVHYKMGRLNFEIAKRLVKIRKIALPNLIIEGIKGDTKLVPELIQDAVTAENI